MLTANLVDAPPITVRVVGDVRGADIGVFWDALAAAVAQDGQHVVLDVSRLDSWSLVAQAMVLHVARQLQSRGRQLILVEPSDQLRSGSERLNVFGEVETRLDARGG
jgi:anti-anti-sigma regulatory factor